MGPEEVGVDGCVAQDAMGVQVGGKGGVSVESVLGGDLFFMVVFYVVAQGFL